LFALAQYCAADFVDAFVDDLKPTLPCQPAKIEKLRFGTLIKCRNPRVKNRSFHPGYLIFVELNAIGYLRRRLRIRRGRSI